MQRGHQSNTRPQRKAQSWKLLRRHVAAATARNCWLSIAHCRCAWALYVKHASLWQPVLLLQVRRQAPKVYKNNKWWRYRGVAAGTKGIQHDAVRRHAGHVFEMGGNAHKAAAAAPEKNSKQW